MTTKKHLFAIFSFCLMGVYAQQTDSEWNVSLGANVVDFHVTNDDFLPTTNFISESFRDDLFTSKDFNFSNRAIYLSAYKNLGFGFNLGISTSFNKVDQYVYADIIPDLDLGFINTDVTFNFNPFHASRIDPFVGMGIGMTNIDQTAYSHLNFGVGLNLWFSERVGLSYRSDYKQNPSTSFNNYFQHNLGLIVKTKKKDQDNDGVPDEEDECPEVPGKAEFNGCPDTDNDGVPDAEDKCPTIAGSKDLNGCPDADGDGVADNEDKCPTKPGSKSAQGCPDADRDGVQDEQDQCPYKPGPASNSGCPETDSDNDGVYDNVDNCPNEAGSAENSGCPEFGAADEAAMKSFTKGLNFIVDTLELYPESEELLVEIAAKIKTYTSTVFIIEAHTDSRGTYEDNQKLSDRRADAIVKKLMKLGVPARNLVAKGMGERYPIATNMYMDGRRQNRRVEIKPMKN